jgi:hypothetical protein
MTTGRPAPPVALELVRADDFEPELARTQQDLARLERELAIAESAAEEAEREVAGVPDDAALHDWVSAQLDRFLEQLRMQHGAEMQQLLDDAHARAAACVQRAQSDADLVLSYAHANLAARNAAIGRSGSGSPASDPSPSVAWRADEPVIVAPNGGQTPAPASVVIPTSTGPVAPEHLAFAPAMTATPVPDAPTPIAPMLDAGSTVVAPNAPPDAFVGSTLTPSAPAFVTAPSVGGGDGDAADPPHDRDFWKGPDPAAGKESLIRRLPMFAILQVVAVVIVLAVVLLRIG